MERGKISSLQMAMLLYPAIIATAILSIPAFTAKYAGNDVWLSPIIASSIGFLAVFIAVKLYHYYPGKTIIQTSEEILGRILGKIIGFLFLSFYIEMSGNIARTYSEFLVTSFLPKTPQIVIIAFMMCLCGFCIYGGLEVLARCGQVLFPLLVFPLLFSLLFLVKDFDFGNILPILEDGLMPSIKGAIVPSGWFAEYFLIAFLLPFLADQNKGMKYGVISVFGTMLTLVMVNLIVLFILGAATASKTYPLMNVYRHISFGGIFENMEAVVMAIWIVGAFVKISVFYYAAALGTAQWLNLSDYRPVIWPLGILISQFSYWGLPNTMALHRTNITDFPLHSISIQILIPLLLLIVAMMKNTHEKKKGQSDMQK